MITKQLIDQIEGEASIYFDMKDDKVDFATISFPHFRGMENILEGKSALDALVITPRVCGICGHAHLMATVRAIEDAYKNSGNEIVLSQKSEQIREFTLIMEMIQNHFKWIYLTIIPHLLKLTSTQRTQTPLKGAYAASIASKVIAIFAGQWPHSSYMIPGGITSDPSNVDILKAQSHLDELIGFFEKETLGASLEEFLLFESCKEFREVDSDIAFIEQELLNTDMHKKGFAHDRFIVAGEHRFTKSAKLNKTRSFKMNVKYIDSVDSYSPKEHSYAKNAQYKNEYYETGPLARTISQKIPLVKNMHRRFKDSAYTRVMARITELGYLLQQAKQLSSGLYIDQDSYTKTVAIQNITAEGVGVVEAPRGPLLHKVSIKNGLIDSYKIITPTQFNIGSSKQSNPTPAQKAMLGTTQEEALFIFRTFDVCSVCTTH